MNAPHMTDEQLRQTKALPNGAANITTDAIDLETSARGDFVVTADLLIEAPVLTTAELPNTETMTYDVVMSDNADLSSPTTLYAGVLVQTGTGGAGAAAAEQRVGLPTDVKRYIGVKATNSGSGNASSKSVIASLKM